MVVEGPVVIEDEANHLIGRGISRKKLLDKWLGYEKPRVVSFFGV